ncbi:unnamed protein product, partial [marine sediment metagenome]
MTAHWKDSFPSIAKGHEQEEKNGCPKTPSVPEKAQGKEEGYGSSQGAMKRVLLLTGKPGTGKTALIKEAIVKTRIRAGGFYTEEIRSGGIRQGFRIITLDGQDGILAHINIPSPYQVSKYRVDINSLNEVGVSAIHQA